ncbi:RNA polymerase I-specific transcription initiation factor Rrn3p [Trichomonascus vanleenenianus]|uniref:rDNA-binding RNA polymerase I transcriptional factor n=1 Tax=Trichomonascus vanleenenianus TaxID=2268995 RepID=UPI003ECA7BFA
MIATAFPSQSLPPAKSSLKRRHSEVGSSMPSSPAAKHHRVNFALPEQDDEREPLRDMEIDQKMDDSFSASMYKSFVHDALEQLDKHDNSEPLNHLCFQVSLPTSSKEALSAGQLQNLIAALTAEISRLDTNNCSPMISAILKLKWSNRDPSFIATYVRFLTVLVSGIPKWWTEVVNKVVSELVLKDTSAHHSVLKYILHLIPTAASALQQIFSKHYPHKLDTTKHTLRYIDNILSVVEYCPELRKSVWALIIERTVQLDVELAEEDDVDDDEDEDREDDDEEVAEDKRDFATDEQDSDDEEKDSDDENDEDDNDDSDEEEEEEEITAHELDDEANGNTVMIRKKLDAIICQLFSYLDGKFTAEQLESGRAIPLFTMLIDLFRDYVLPTHRTRSVQFLVFRTCHSHPDLLEAFLTAMMELALNPAEDIERRQKAMQYISTFIARAKGLSREQVILVVGILAKWIEEYIKQREKEVDEGPGGMGRFKMFYSISQALFYIFCFRHELLKKDQSQMSTEEASGSEWECDLDKLFQRMIVTKFNPLRYCKRTVVAMFARIAQKEDAAYCFTIMEQNRLGGFKSSSPSGSGTTTPKNGVSSGTSFFSNSLWKSTSEFVSLEGYFPFDPLNLRRARSAISDIYVEWGDVAGDDADSGSENYDDSDDNDSDDNE